MKFKEKIYNNDNLDNQDIDEKTTRARAIIINFNNNNNIDVLFKWP